MKLILIFPIHKQCWRNSCRICPSWLMMKLTNFNWIELELQKALTGDRNFSISCLFGVCYPTLWAMMNREDVHLLKTVRFHFNGYAYEILGMCCVYTIHVLTKIFWYTNYTILICHVYVVYILYIYWLKYLIFRLKYFDMQCMCCVYTIHILTICFVMDMTQPQV